MSEPQPPASTEVPADEPAEEIPEEYREPFSRAIAICTVVTTLLAAVVGLMLADSSGEASEAAGQAQQLSIRASGEAVRAQQAAQADFETFVLAQEQRTRSSSALQRGLFEQDRTEKSQLKVRQALWQLQAENTETLTPLTTTSEFGPEADPLFPARFFTAAAEEAYRLSALEDAASTTSEAWGSQAAGYTAVLTMFAVALYLFGLTLTLGRESRRLFAGVALVLVAVGFGWSAWVYLHPPDKISDRAADEFAAGEIAFFTASSKEGFAQAAEHYRETIDLRPEFALAHARLAKAEYQAGSQQGAVGYVTMSSPEALDIAISELERARELGLETFEVVAALGAYHYQRGILTDSTGDLRASVDLTEEALVFDPDSELIKLNLGLGHLAAGDEEAARRYLTEGAESADSYLIASSMAVLSTLEEEGPKSIAEKVPEFKALLAAAAPIPVKDAPAPGEFELTDLKATPFPSSVQITFGADGGFDSTKDLLQVFWYHRNEGDPGWSAVQEVSYYHYATPNSNAPGTYFIQTPYLTATIPRRCLPAGSYRVEVYAGDRLVGSTEADTVFNQMDAATFADLNAAFCRPAGWEPVTDESLARPGLVRGYRSPDGSAGAYMFRLAPAAATHIGSLPPDELAGVLLDLIVTGWDLGLGGTPELDSFNEGYFMGLEAGRQNFYTYPGGHMLAGAGVDEDGSVVVGVTYGPPGFFDTAPGNDGGWILDSAIPFTPPTGN